MMTLVFGMWSDILSNPTSKENKITAICAVLQVYSSLIGMTDDDFKDMAHKLGKTYIGPLPDVYNEEVIRFYEEIKNHE